jgi:type IV pilus assembly protein PilY1
MSAIGPCEGWGTSVNGQLSAYLRPDRSGANLTLLSFVVTPPPPGNFTSALSVVRFTTGAELVISHLFTPSAQAPGLFEGLVTLTNSGTTPLADVRYRRVMAWDPSPTPGRAFVTIQGVGAGNLLFSSDNGYASANPLDPAGFILPGTVNTNFTDSGPTDHGAVFDFGFGTLAPGQSVAFSLFYGTAATEAEALAALAAVGAEVYSLAQSDTPGGPTLGTPATFIFGARGVGGIPLSAVPEPGSLALVAIGSLGLIGYAWRRRQRAA